MIKISPAILNDTSIFLYKTVGTNYKGNYLKFFLNNRDLFEIKKPQLVDDFINKLSIGNINLLHKSNYESIVSIKKAVILKYIKQINPTWRKRITWGIKLEVFKHIKENY